jgi:hypothetical protein
MSLRHSRFLERFAIFAFVLGLHRHACAQACCAGAGTVTPGRLALHEVALVGLQLKTAGELGAFDAQARYDGSPPGASELDLEQDVFAAVRVLNRAQVAM